MLGNFAVQIVLVAVGTGLATWCVAEFIREIRR